ncbi:MAG TPA: lysophospholipid acyltransferase family protein [Gaiellaceae bacterium]|nr:lysophospholipid acyltransferase family protein [Gaiellaceae bacterium]
MNRIDLVWAIGRVYIGRPVRWLTRARGFGVDNVPATGGVVYAINHLHWIDIPLVGLLSPRTVWFVAKAEAANHPVGGWILRAHGAIAIRRGESDRDAVRRMRDEARAGHVIGLFVEGTRQRNGRPGTAQPGAAMVALQEDVPVIPVAIYGTQFWKPGNFRRCSVAFGEPLRFEGLPKNGKGYREATQVIERRIHELFDELERRER